MNLTTVLLTICVLLIGAQFIWLGVKVVMTSLVLLVVVTRPWRAAVIRSLELLGSLTIELQEVNAATEKVAGRLAATCQS